MGLSDIPFTPRQSFRVASFNVENLAHPGAFFAGRAGDAGYTEALYADKLAWIGRILDEGRVDLVGFQELFSWRAVNEAVARSSHLAGATTVLAPTIENGRNERVGDDGRVEVDGPHVGLATRFPVVAHSSIAAFPAVVDLRIPTGLHGEDGEVVRLPLTRFERPVLSARVLLPFDTPATVFVAHLKSKRPRFLVGEDPRDPVVQALGKTRALIVRAAEAVALRALVAAALDDPENGRRGEPVIVLGDLNDDLGADTTQVIAGEPAPTTAPQDHKQRAWDVLLYSAHDLQEERSYRNVSFTHIYNGRYELLDHVFVSQEFVRPFPQRVGQVTQTRIFNDHIFDSRFAADREEAHLVVAGKRLRLPSRRSDHGVPVTEIEMLPRSHCAPQDLDPRPRRPDVGGAAQGSR